MQGQFGPAGEVKNERNKQKYVTDEGELLQGTAIVKGIDYECYASLALVEGKLGVKKTIIKGGSW